MNKDLRRDIQELVNLRENTTLLLKLAHVSPFQSIKIWEKLNKRKKKIPILDVILQTGGGSADAAYTIAKTLTKSAKTLNIIVPLYAKSAGTLLALCADEIILTNLSELGPLDTQLSEESEGTPISALDGFKALEQIQTHTLETLDSTTRLIREKFRMKLGDAINLASDFCGQTSGTLYSQLDPKKIGEYARALEVGEYYGRKLLTTFKGWAENTAESTVKKLVYSYPSHKYIIDFEELKSIKIPAKLAEPVEIKVLHKIRMNLLETEGSSVEIFTPSKKTKSKTKK